MEYNHDCSACTLCAVLLADNAMTAAAAAAAGGGDVVLSWTH